MENPKIRFKGFTKDWEQRKWMNSVDISTEMVDPASGEYDDMPHIAPGNIESFTGRVLDNVRTVKEEQLISGKFRFRPDDVVYGKINPQLGKYFYASVDGLTSADAYVFKGKNGITQKFLFSLLQTSDFFKYSVSVSKRSGMPKINRDELNAYAFLAPSEEEQDKIGNFLLELDHLITLHQRKCEQTKKLKKYMLQKMFPQNGEKIPKIRFDGFTYDWEQRKFGEITELKSASRVHKDEWTSNGVPFYRSSDVMTAINGTENEKAFISEELYEKLSKVSGKLEEGDILVTGGGSVGNPYIVPDNKPLYTKDADLLWIKNKGKFHPYFLYEFFFSPTFRNYLGSISHVGTIAHYTITQLSDTPISLPSFEEQKEVGEYFQSLDCLITLHQRKCDELKKMKKYMLQNMFI